MNLTRIRIDPALVTYAALLLAFWLGVRHSPLAATLAGLLPWAFLAFALLLSPLWLFGFGAGEWLRERCKSRVLRMGLGALLGLPCLALAIPGGYLRWSLLVAMFGLPVVLAALLEFSSPGARLAWQDAVVLGVLVAVYMSHLLAGAWPYSGLGGFSKLYIADLALYLYVVVRRLEGMGYSLRPQLSAIATGLREWLYFVPFGIGLGLALHFIHFHDGWPSAARAAGILLVTFVWIAIPEEMFFRGILQNLLETRLGRNRALLATSLLFGLAHFNKGAVFNWRYVLLAAIAGVFYGRAWRQRRQILASTITHTAVDVVWALWFR